MHSTIELLTQAGSRVITGWGELDTWIVISAALAAMACALPGNYLLLRRQSMIGDALTHTVLPGIVGAFLLTHWLKTRGIISVARSDHAEAFDATSYAAMFGGAVVVGVLTAILTEWVQKQGRIENTAALGVVYTTLFACGLLMIRTSADSVHIDPDCVLYGNVEIVVLDAVLMQQVPKVAIVSGVVLLANGVLVLLFFKELRISTFDPQLATTLGVNSSVIHYCLMAVTAVTAVAAFESVGNILVVAMLIVPPATAHLLTDRLWLMIVLSLAIAASSALLGHIMAFTLPPLVFAPVAERLGLTPEKLKELDASTAGMMAAAAGLLFTLALLAGPRHGIISRLLYRSLLGLRIASEDILGLLYRQAESEVSSAIDVAAMGRALPGISPLLTRLALWRLVRRGLVIHDAPNLELTADGHAAARDLVRTHRLWETYMARHFDVPGDHLHETAHRVEHFIDPELRDQLDNELDRPETDPHGREIPGAGAS